ncbi:hypothetical protein PVAP13_7NG295900 [Panicum virgatum]|uniref:Uncharacterized protein n=1 Tax=Panicum virgatum TaxID=38727 RepID=A0A8T0Q644_PANVG|nr:hypothetical protein PVAP13_7NG295900 [Panicum virgatum]
MAMATRPQASGPGTPGGGGGSGGSTGYGSWATHTLRNPVQYKSNSSCHRQSTYASVRPCLTVSRHVLPLAQSPQATYHVPSKFYGYADLPLSPLATAGLEPAGYQN